MPQKRFDIVMGGVVIKDLIPHPFVLSIVHRREDAVVPLVEFIDCHLAGKCFQGIGNSAGWFVTIGSV